MPPGCCQPFSQISLSFPECPLLLIFVGQAPGLREALSPARSTEGGLGRLCGPRACLLERRLRARLPAYHVLVGCGGRCCAGPRSLKPQSKPGDPQDFSGGEECPGKASRHSSGDPMAPVPHESDEQHDRSSQ